MRRLPLLLVFALASLTPNLVQAEKADPALEATKAAREAAIQAAVAYDAGRCSQVLGILGALPEASVAALDGVSHYRWGYCQGLLRRDSPLDQYRESARKLAVEAEAEDASVDAYFYRVNALLNLRKSDEAREAAARAVERWKGGTLTVAQDDGRAWFRLGKLHRDAGQTKGAAEPFKRALALHDAGDSRLNDAYLQRIADGLRAAGDDEGAMKALAALQKLRPADPQTALREARTLIAGGDYEAARKLVQKARAGTGDTAMLAQYTAYGIVRLQELAKWDLAPAESLADGTPIVEADLRGELRASAREAFQLFQGPAIEVPRKKNKAVTRLKPAPEVDEQMRITQSIFCGLLKEALLRGAPLREWAIADGYAPLIHHPWRKLFREQAEKRKAAESESAEGGQR